MTELLDYLKSRYRPQTVLDLSVGFAVGPVVTTHPGEHVVTVLDLHTHEFCDPHTLPVPAAPDLTLYFETPELALALLSGAASPIDAFMSGHFRASGYIVETFAILRMFPPESASTAS